MSPHGAESDRLRTAPEEILPWITNGCDLHDTTFAMGSLQATVSFRTQVRGLPLRPRSSGSSGALVLGGHRHPRVAVMTLVSNSTMFAASSRRHSAAKTNKRRKSRIPEVSSGELRHRLAGNPPSSRGAQSVNGERVTRTPRLPGRFTSSVKAH